MSYERCFGFAGPAAMGGFGIYGDRHANGGDAPIPAIRRVAIWAARFDPLGSCRRSRVERAPLSSYIATDRFRAGPKRIGR